jgi:hypothetical protein
MPPTNGEIVLAAFARFNSRDWERATSVLHPEFVWINDADTAGVMGTPVELHGPVELRDWWQSFFGQWDEWRMDTREPQEGSGGSILIPCRFIGRGPGSGVPIEFDFFQVWDFKDAMPVRITNIRDREAASKAAGLA